MQAEGLMKRFEDKNPSSLVNVDYIHMYGYIHVVVNMCICIYISIYRHIKIYCRH